MHSYENVMLQFIEKDMFLFKYIYVYIYVYNVYI